MTETFHKALHYTLPNEGGFSNIKEDVGGPTKFGVTIAVLSHWRQKPCEPDDVRGMDLQEAERIYFAWYWKPLDLDMIKYENVAIALFDRAVKDGLTGCSQKVRLIFKQDASHKLWNHHEFNDLMQAVNAAAPAWFVMSLADLCDDMIERTVSRHVSQLRFYNGWKNRVNRMRRELGDGHERPFTKRS